MQPNMQTNMQPNAATSAELYSRRLARVRAEMKSRNVDALVVSVGFDLPYLVGYHAMPLERLTRSWSRIVPQRSWFRALRLLA